jgi:long-chain fatty acid transport protein
VNQLNKQIINQICIGLIFIATIGVAYGDGYRNPPPTAEGIAKSGVNSVWVDDASAISYNPANLAFQTNQSVVLSLTLARTENTYTIPSLGSYESDGDWNVLPNIYCAVPVGDNGWSAGLGINTPYGQGLSWDKSDLEPLVGAGELLPYEARVALININPTLAYQVSDALSVGVGIDIIYSTLELKSLLDSAALGGTTGTVYNAEAFGDGWGAGINLALTWVPVDGQRLALTYRSQFEVDYKGDFDVAGTKAGDLESTTKYPNIVTIGYGVQLPGEVQLEAMIEWLQWSLNDTQPLSVGGVSLDQDNNWDDTFSFGIGGSWQALDSLVVRAGYAFIPSPIPDETISYLLPDADRHALSFGLGYTLGVHTLDLAYTASFYEERNSSLGSDYEINSNLIGLTYSFLF